MTSQMSNTDWQSGKEFAETNLYMLEHEIACDVTFRIGAEQTTVRAHKFMLISRSHVFSAMLCGSMAETGEIEIPDVDHDVFRMMLRFIYTNNVTPDCDHVMCLLYLAKKYNITKLEDICLEYLATSMTTENVCTILEHTKLFDEKEVYKTAMAFTEQNGESVLESEGFLSLSQETVLDIVKSGSLCIGEEDVFHAVNTWAERQCHKRGTAVTPDAKREVLGSVMKHVRFPRLSQEFIVTTVSSSGLLTPQEQLKILQHSICPDEVPSTFPTEPRLPPAERCVYRFKTESEDSWGAGFSTNALSLKCSKTIKMHGFMLYGPKDEERGSYDVYAKLLDEEGIMQTEVETTVEVQRNECKMFSIYFPKLVQIQANKFTTICVKLKGPRTYYGVKDTKQVVVDKYIFDFVDSELRTIDKTFPLTPQIPGLIFSGIC